MPGLCVGEAYDYFMDLQLLLAVVAGYFVSNFLFKKSPTPASVKSAPGPARVEKSTFDCAALPVEVQARVADLAGLGSWANLASASSMNQYALIENDALWSNIAGSKVGLAEFRRKTLAIDQLATIKLSTEEEVRTVVRVINAAKPSDNVADEIAALVGRTVGSAHALFWQGVGQEGADMTEIHEAAMARADIFTQAQLETVGHNVEEHKALLDMLEVPQCSDVDFSVQLSADAESQVSRQFRACC
jgi:hypothetical protein